MILMARPAEEPFERRRLFTYEEANALLPRLALLVPSIQKGYAVLREHLSGRGLELDSPNLYRAVQEDPAIRGAVDRLAADLSELEGLGAVFQGPELGLVDFPSLLQGEEVMLCWQYGEKRIEWFHGAQDGFKGRRRLPHLAQPTRYD